MFQQVWNSHATILESWFDKVVAEGSFLYHLLINKVEYTSYLPRSLLIGHKSISPQLFTTHNMDLSWESIHNILNVHHTCVGHGTIRSRNDLWQCGFFVRESLAHMGFSERMSRLIYTLGMGAISHIIHNGIVVKKRIFYV